MTRLSPELTAQDVTRVVAELLPILRKQARTSLALIAGAIVLGGVVALGFLRSNLAEEDRWEYALYAVITGFVVAYASYRWTTSTQEELLMPVLARSIGFAYGKNARGFVASLPDRLMPTRAEVSGEDHLKGTLGAYAIQMAQVTAETGGKDSTVLFKGIVAQFPNRTAMPAFFIAPEDKTRPAFFLGGNLSTKGLEHLRSVQAGGRSFGVWTSASDGPEPPALSAVIDILTSLDMRIGQVTQFYAATSDGKEMHVALTQKRDLFRLGSLVPTEARVFSGVQRAMQDLTIPLTLAQALMQAEEAVIARS